MFTYSLILEKRLFHFLLVLVICLTTQVALGQYSQPNTSDISEHTIKSITTTCFNKASSLPYVTITKSYYENGEIEWQLGIDSLGDTNYIHHHTYLKNPKRHVFSIYRYKPDKVLYLSDTTHFDSEDRPLFKTRFKADSIQNYSFRETNYVYQTQKVTETHLDKDGNMRYFTTTCYQKNEHIKSIITLDADSNLMDERSYKKIFIWSYIYTKKALIFDELNSDYYVKMRYRKKKLSSNTFDWQPALGKTIKTAHTTTHSKFIKRDKPILHRTKSIQKTPFIGKEKSFRQVQIEYNVRLLPIYIKTQWWGEEFDFEQLSPSGKGYLKTDFDNETEERKVYTYY